MNRRPPMALPAKPPIRPGPNPGHAPPLPTGPPPQQPQQQQSGYPQQTPEQASAHAAAWAAYYQSQSQGTAPNYAAGPSQSQPQAGQPGSAGNPYANYGYGAGAQHGRPPAQPQVQPQVQPQGYPMQPQQAYPQAGPQFPQQGYPGYGVGPVAGPQQPYRPPVPGPQGYPQQQQQGYPNQQAQQPFYPQQHPQQPYQNQNPQQFQPQQPFSPAHSQGYGQQSPNPTPQPLNRPFQPQNTPMRPPIRAPPGPPAKRPRFDGPGPGSAPGPGMGRGMISSPNPNIMQNRPPVRPMIPQPAISRSGIPIRPVIPHAFRPQGQGNVRPQPPVSTPRGPSSVVVRPPIRLGLGGPPPLGLGGNVRIPRGPSVMRRGGGAGGGGEGDRKRRERERERDRERDREKRERERDREREAKTTMTDFRIVGIEIEGEGWKWGLTGDEAGVQEEDFKVEKMEAESRDEGEKGDEAEVKVDAPVDVKQEEGSEAEVPKSAEKEINGEESAAATETTGEVEDDTGESAETTDAKRGEKRKAKTPDGDEGSSPKKRPSEYILTHGKPSAPPTQPSADQASTAEANQNRFRIYFESPPELDRVPKAMRRNPNKRWRRESSSVAPGRAEEEGGAGANRSVVGESVIGEGVEEVPEGEEAGHGEEEDVAVVEGQEQVEQSAVVEHTEGGENAEVAAVDGGDDNFQDCLEVEGEVVVDGAAQEGDQARNEDQVSGTAVNGTETTDSVDPPVADEVLRTTALGDESAEIAQSETTAPISAPVSEEVVQVTVAVEKVETIDEEEQVDVGDVSMRTDSASIAAAIAEVDETEIATESAAPDQVEASQPTTPIPVPSQPRSTLTPSHSLPPKPTLSSAKLQTAEELAASASNAASAYSTRTRRRSLSTAHDAESKNGDVGEEGEGVPSVNRLSILYEDSTRRVCLDAAVVERVRIYREVGKIEVVLVKGEVEGGNGDVKVEDGEDKAKAEDGAESVDALSPATPQGLPKGILLEKYDSADQRFIPVTPEDIASDTTIPPLQYSRTLTVYLNKKRPLSEPKWCRTDSADDWLYEQFGVKKASGSGGWKGKLEVVDPDPAPTLQTLLEQWATSSSISTIINRRAFTSSLLSSPLNTLEILLRLTRGDRNPPVGPHATPTLSADSPYASHQTHVSLAVLAMYRLTTDYAAKAGEKAEVLDEKIGDIVKSLPVGILGRSLEGLFREWEGKGK